MTRLIFVTVLCLSFVWLWHLTMPYQASNQAAANEICMIIIEDIVHRTGCPNGEPNAGSAFILPEGGTLLADAQTQDFIIASDLMPYMRG